ncbi:uncharacterized protein LOC106180408 isoform X1 [Lingula anatina]|uniref:Uncharacterized protein LOC106180408 isoform X1 n=1 Tax=Lingula anatina TaxID=7574 RepID=A0A1S3KC57_LINAN|nr:uncharacterized protein LOC106180408 isoform X1 [Lingula anatina]|eukprot:XP_013419841.1 uncharacterized protein LOC106180408 isoform X1 [Lingula anatina]
MKSLVFALSFLGFLSVGTAIKCYVCNNGDPNCGETLAATADDPAYVQDCPNTNGCMKIDATHIGTDKKTQDAKRVVIRKCFYTVTPQTDTCKVYTQGNLRGIHCMCTGALCNSGSGVNTNLVVLAFSVLVAAIFSRLI